MRMSYSSSRRSRLVWWCLCFLVSILIVYWSKKQRTVESAEHVYRPDGLLDVNPKGKHPILELIERSETQWKRKLERQSKTLKQAVDEYKRRYKRLPPKGFERWWHYVESHDVKLVDEYDSIHDRLEPFWGVSPAVLQRVQADCESQGFTFTIGKLPGSTTVQRLNHTIQDASRLGHQRVQDQLDLLTDVQQWLPEFRATFTSHDGPAQFVSWELRNKAVEAAERGEYIDVPHIAASIKEKGWAAACPPNTPIHSYVPPPLPTDATQKPAYQQPPPLPSSKSFIYDHRLSMSPCLHPTHLTLNGYFSQYRYSHQNGPDPSSILAPTFSICVSPLNNDLIAVAPEQYADDVGVDPAWVDKVDSRLLWRGSNTGTRYGVRNMWNSSQRIRLVETATRRGGEMRVLLPRGPGGAWDGPVGYGESVPTSVLNAAFMDVAFVGKPMQCVEPVCEQLKKMFEWRSFQSWQDAWLYKYIMDMDGNGWSARFKRLMTSNSLIFKSTIYPEWYTERIMPWVHYVPVQINLSDLYDILAFFRGDLAGEGARDDLAERIATAGKTWSREFYRRKDMTAYHFRLFLEYARVMSLDRDAMSYREGVET